jgi:osmotically-inducible protein OsmY
MSVKRTVLIFAITTCAAMAAAEASPMTSTYVYFDGQKAEPNSQVPAVPQANNPATSNGGLGQPDPAANAALQGRIQQALHNDPTLASTHVSVSVTDSAVELSGTVASGKDKETAERIAQSFDNNRKFTDRLIVAGQAAGANNAGKSNSSTASSPKH